MTSWTVRLTIIILSFTVVESFIDFFDCDNWSSWSTCPVTCGGSTYTRTRRCCIIEAFSICIGRSDFTDTGHCNTQCCPVHGGWGDWEEWYACTVTCGTGSQYRFRYCNNPLVYCNGNDCPSCSGSYCGYNPKKSTETRSCNELDCNVCGNRVIGYGTTSSLISSIGSNSGYGILAESGFYEATCCGIISSWEFYVSRSGELHLMVWRKSGTTYTLVGKNIYTVASNLVGRTITYSVAERDRLTIMNNDMLGWYTPSSEIIPYSGSIPDNFRKTSMAVTEEGNTFDWSTVTKTHDVAYAIRANTGDNETPFFTNLNREVVIYDDQPIGSNIYRLEYYNGDTRDTITLTYTSTTTSLSFNTVTKQIYLASSLAIGVYNIIFYMEDSCGNIATSASLTVTVMNTPPRITNLPSSITLHEDVVEGSLLYEIDVIDRQTDTITCSLSAETPFSDNFRVELVDGTTEYGIYLKSSPTFDFTSTKKYTLTISCEDGKNSAVTGDYFVHIQKNHPPRFVNLPASIDLNASSTLIGDLVYSAAMTDDESDTLTFTMTTDPNNAPFQLLDYGDVVTTADLSTIFTPAYNLEISVDDGRTTVGPRTLSVHIINMNDRPIIANLPLTQPFRIEENEEVGKTLYHVLVRDLDTTDTHLIQGIYSPESGSTYFSLSADGYLNIASSLDFEAMPATTFEVVIEATDSKDTATSTVTLIITDENEPPVFHQAGYSVEAFEGNQNDPFPSADLVINDPDSGESFIYWLDCGNDTWRFTMAANTGSITYAYNYDVDKLLTTRYDCVVRAKDTGFNTCTASLVITIKDANDNHPYFNQTQYAFYVSPYESIGTEIGNVTAYDVDISAFGTLTYNLDMSAYTELYIQINNDGTLYVNKLLSSRFQSGNVMDLTLTAIDYGGLSTSVQILIIFPEENTTTSSTTPALVSFTTSSENTLWFTALAILLAMTAIGTLYFSAKYCMTINFFQTTSVNKKLTNSNKSDSTERSSSKKLKSIDMNKPNDYHNPTRPQPYSKIINVPKQERPSDVVSTVTNSSVMSSHSKHLYKDKDERSSTGQSLLSSVDF